MSFKLILTYFFIILDVVIFPFSCTNQNSNKNEFLFVIQIEDQVNDVFYYSRYVEKLSNDNIINYPENWEYELPLNYQIIEWCILDANHELKTEQEIVFPFEITEEDKIKYFEGHRNCVVFKAIWECTKNDEA